MSALGRPPLATVVVVNFNGRHHLERCLPALFVPTQVDFEVIVADNGSTDESLEWLAQNWPAVRVLVLGKNLGFGAANGRGVAAARGEFVAFLNNDTVVEPGWLAALLEPLQADAEIAASCSTLRLLEHLGLLNARGGAMTSPGYGFDIDFMVPIEREPACGRSGRWRDVLFPTAAAMAMRRSDFIAIGGFDPKMFMYHEDVDLGLRLWITGRRVVVCDDSMVAHAFGGTSSRAQGFAWRERLGMRHNVRTLLKCYSLVGLLRAGTQIARIWWIHRAVRQAISTCCWNLLHLGSTLPERRRLQRHKVRSEEDLYRRRLITGVAWPPGSPEPPAPDDPATVADLIVTPTLLPGQHSALGRLGAGWFAPEKLDGETLRWTCGLAKCTLRVAPEQTGRLEADVTFGPQAEDANVTLTCNGATINATAGSQWTAVSVPARSNSQGLLHVAITTPTWTPHDLLGNSDFRTLGCAVRAIRFRPVVASSRSPEPTVSVVIPTHNRWATLEDTLSALARQTCRPFEVVVVDDGSTDGTSDNLRAWHRRNATAFALIALWQENAKQGRARNLGLQAAHGELVVLLGDDIVPEPDFLATHVAAHLRLDEPAAVVGFTDWHRDRMLVTPFLEFVNADGQQFAYGHLADGKECPYTCFYTSNISLPKAVLGKEPFDPRFKSYGWEDVELGYRLCRRGLRIIYCREAIARHAHPMTLREFFRRQRHVGSTVDAVFAIHPELASDPYMPPLRAALSVRVLGVALPILVPLLSLLDRLGARLPARLYRGALLASYFGERHRRAGEAAPP